MSAGLFGLICPQCNGELETDHRGMAICARCQRAYLNRFGHLIPIDYNDVSFELGGARSIAPRVTGRNET